MLKTCLSALFTALISDAGSANELPDSAVQWLGPDTVSAPRKEKEILSISDEEKRFGYADDINQIVFLQPGIERIPEAGSSLLIKGEGIFDNQFLIYGVPMFAPSHFTNHSFSDKSGAMIATLESVRLATDNIAGRYSGFSGGILELEPGIARIANPRWKSRPEATVNFGTLNRDFTLSMPFREDKNMYQLSVSNTDDYLIRWKNYAHQSPFTTSGDAALGYAVPKSFGDIMLTGKNIGNKLRVRHHTWVAWDSYNESIYTDRGLVPWGMGAVSIDGEAEKFNWQSSVGAARQHYFEGKRFGPVIPLTHIVRSNGTASWALDGLQAGALSLDFSLQGDYQTWYGDIESRYTTNGLTDSVSEKHESRDETEMRVHAGAKTQSGFLAYGANAIAGGIIPANTAYIDPGIWAQAAFDKVKLDASAGIITARPDIRGLPDEQYRSRLLRTYTGSAGVSWAQAAWTRVSARGYVKYKDHAPARSESPADPSWDPARATPLFARGADVQWDIDIREKILLTFLQNISASERLRDTGRTVYEWDIPWSHKAILQAQVVPDLFDIYIIGIFAQGLPYQDVVWKNGELAFSEQINRMPFYRRIDLKLQFKQQIENSRFITRFDAYIFLPNVLNFIESLVTSGDLFWKNTREYYWNEDLARMPVKLEDFTTSIGLRMGFRL